MSRRRPQGREKRMLQASAALMIAGLVLATWSVFAGSWLHWLFSAIAGVLAGAGWLVVRYAPRESRP